MIIITHKITNGKTSTYSMVTAPFVAEPALDRFKQNIIYPHGVGVGGIVNLEASNMFSKITFTNAVI